MAQENIKIKSCLLKKQTEKFKVYTVETEDGRKGETFAEMTPGQFYAVEAENDPQYGWKFKVKKSGGAYAKSGYTPNLKLEAMKLSVQLCANGKLDAKDIYKGADKIFEYIKPTS